MGAVVSVQREMVAEPEAVWALVSDLPNMGDWSPENDGGSWTGDATEAEVEPAAADAAGSTKTPARKPAAATPKPPKPDKQLKALFNAALDASADDEGWAHLGSIGQYISKQQPDFDARNYGQKRLSDLVKATAGYELQTRKSADGKASAHYMRRA